MKSTLPGLALLGAFALGGWQLGKKWSASPIPSSLRTETSSTSPASLFPAFKEGPTDHSRLWQVILSETDAEQRLQLLGNLISKWAPEDPGRAWTFLLRDMNAMGGETEPRLAGFAGSIFLHWALRDGWESARQAAVGAPLAWQEQIGRVLGDLRHQMPGKSPSTREMVSSLTDSPPAVRTGILAAMLAKNLEGALPAAADWQACLKDLQINGWAEGEQETLTQAISSKSMAADPKTTADWLATLPGSPAQRSQRLNHIVWQWAQGQGAANACGDWLNTQPSGPETDEALVSFSKIALRDDPESAVAWAQRIQDPAQREAVTRDHLRQWLLRSPGAAAAAAVALGLKLPPF